MADLITAARAKYNLAFDGTFSAAEDTTIDALVTACSRAIKKYCGREFDSQSFDELHDGLGQAELLLREYPVLSIARVAHAPIPVLNITNTSSTNQRATVAVTSTGLTLVRVASGTTTTVTSVTWSGNATLSAVASAVTALGNGWSASVTEARYASWPSADLRALQGALNARDGDASLVLHVSELAAFDVEEKAGILTRSPCDLDGPGWYGGRRFWRVLYTAGYATVPEDVQEACAEWVAYLYGLTQRDPATANTFSAAEGTTHARLDPIPASVKMLLDPYRKRRV